MPKVKASKVLKGSGFPSGAIPTALGIIQAESHGDPKAVNDRQGCGNHIEGGVLGIGGFKVEDHAVGWFQVCTIHAGKCGIPTSSRIARAWLQDPINNSKAAHCIWKNAGNTFSKDWPTFHTGITGPDFDIEISRTGLGALSDALGQAGEDIVSAGETVVEGAASVATSIPDAINAVAGAIGKIGELGAALTKGKTWVRLGEGALGGTLLIVGVFTITYIAANRAASSPAVQGAAGAATDAIKIAKVVK